MLFLFCHVGGRHRWGVLELVFVFETAGVVVVECSLPIGFDVVVRTYVNRWFSTVWGQGSPSGPVRRNLDLFLLHGSIFFAAQGYERFR